MAEENSEKKQETDTYHGTADDRLCTPDRIGSDHMPYHIQLSDRTSGGDRVPEALCGLRRSAHVLSVRHRYR